MRVVQKLSAHLPSPWTAVTSCHNYPLTWTILLQCKRLNLMFFTSEYCDGSYWVTLWMQILTITCLKKGQLRQKGVSKKYQQQDHRCSQHQFCHVPLHPPALASRILSLLKPSFYYWSLLLVLFTLIDITSLLNQQLAKCLETKKVAHYYVRLDKK